MPRHPGKLDRISGRFMTQLRRDEKRGEETEEEALERMRGFDPMAAVRDANRAQFDQVREDLGDDLRDLRGSQVGRGRLRTGFGFDEEDELIGDTMEDFSRAATARSLAGARMGQQNTRDLLGAGQNFSGRYLDILAGERDTEILRNNLERQQRGRRAGGIGSLLGGGLGLLLGGEGGRTVGAMVGSGIGGSLGDLFG